MRFNIIALMILLVGCFWIYDGLQRGARYYPLLNRPSEQLIVYETANLNGRTILPEYVALGYVSDVDSPVMVEIFQNQFKKLKRFDGVNVYRLDLPSRTEWVNGEKLEESKPILSVLGVHFSWQFPAGFVMAACGFVWARQSHRRLKVILTLPDKHSSPADSGVVPPKSPQE